MLCFLLVFEIRAEEIAADASEKIVAERVLENLAAARRVDFEEGEKPGDETPRPLQLAVFLERRLVDVQVFFALQ